VIALTEQHATLMGGFETERHKMYKTVDVDVRNVPVLLSMLNHILSSSILQLIANHFLLNVEDVVMDDLFVVKYSVGEDEINQTSLPPHQDDSVLSFVITLNGDDEYEGGGTEFVNWKCSNQQQRVSRPCCAGVMTSFCGLQLHAGKTITRGTRYILAGFLKVDDVDKKTRQRGEKMFPYPHGR